MVVGDRVIYAGVYPAVIVEINEVDALIRFDDRTRGWKLHDECGYWYASFERLDLTCDAPEEETMDA